MQSTNVGEQFHLFTSLCAWLIRNAQIGQMEMPHEFDDPNATIAQILDALKGKVCQSKTKTKSICEFKRELM